MMGTELSLIRILLVLSTLLYAESQSPCLKLNDVPPVRYVNFYDQNYPLVLGVSNRLTHRLTTEVVKIYAKEVLGYPNVIVKKMTEASNIQKVLLQFFNIELKQPPSIMVDLEAWVPVGVSISNFLEEAHVRECGTLGAHVRFGWFISTEMVARVVNASFVTYDSFLTPERAEVFSLVDEDLLKISASKKFEPAWCKTRRCATVIASSHDFAADFIRDDINRMHLYAKVYWVEDHFTPLMNELLGLYSNPSDPRRSARIPVIFGHSLELLPLRKSFTYVIFPVCEPFTQKSWKYSCHYEGQSIVKLAWSELGLSARAFYDTLLKVDFNETDYQDLVDLYHDNSSEGYSDAACKWLKKNEDRALKLWIPNETKEELVLAGIFPLYRTVFNPQGTYAAARMAVDEINESKLLGNYEINLKLHDGDCRAEIVMRTFISYVTEDYRKIIGFLGPACSETVEPLAGVSAFFETVVISYSAEGSSFDRSKYPYFFRTIGENRQYQFVYQQLFRLLGWKRVATLSEDGTKYTEYVSQTQDLLTKEGVVFIANRKFSHNWMNESNKMKEYLEEFKLKEARIIIADVNEGAAKSLMCEAYHLNMTAKHGFVWFLPSWLMPFWKETALLHNETIGERNLYCSSQEMLVAIDAHLSLSHAFFAPDNETILTNKTVKEWKNDYRTFLHKTYREKSQYSDYAGYAYDAVWVYAKALDLLIRENATYISNMRSKNVTARFVHFIQNTNFSGVSGRIEFKSGASRNATRVNIFQWNSKERKRVEVGHYDSKSDVIFFFNTTAIRWLTENNQPPWDGTKEEDCIVDWIRKALDSDCQTALVVANIVGFGLVLLLVLFGFLVIKHRYDKKVQLTEKYMKSLGLDLLSVSAMNGLDTWEIPKDRVVINRKLGEGAFGMVYGGEAFFEEKGWVAVAVKTLKVGSTTEQKLDFLSEAEVMKRFDHKNVVQLLGVCTKSEPVYTVMEFMLYGDLKTFLLARRHLVNAQNILDDNDEVSSIRLTNMALDIARALSYLAERKYVHRDVASRNCLVNASRVVKLGDFGMTRTMCDNDYYKFTRKGWLPVRWMAPESLGMGVFTPASDVWSFGVLLYEIITFGNFPFQGMTNREVLDYVKEGHTLAVPNGVKANLEGLIKSCWNIDPQKRPPAAEIVDFLANNPRLLSPSLDGPLLSVPPVEESTFSMPFSAEGNKTRKFSLRQRTSASPSNDLRPWTEVSEPLLPSLSGTHRSEGFHTIPEDQIAIQDSTFPL